MKTMHAAAAAIAFALLAGFGANEADAAYRQYYSSWSYHPTNNYYYSTYYHKPTPNYNGYSYHYCVYHPATPRYVYYYNPYRRQYWGRFDCEGKPGEQYSLLKEEDRKEKLGDIAESAFPKPGPMPTIPEATDGTAIEPAPAPPSQDLPPAVPAKP